MSVYKKNNKWYCQFQINKERHHFLCAGATTKAEAERIENAFKYKTQQQQNGVIPRDDKKNQVKLKTLKNNFLEYSKINRAVHKQDIGRLKIAFQFFDENRNAETLVRKDVEEFKAWLLERKLSKKTVNMYLGIFRLMFNLAIKDELLTKNPFASEVQFKLDPTKIKYLADESQKPLDESTPDYFKPIILVALNLGLRRGNIINLQWKNIDFNFKTVEITINKGKKDIKLPMNHTLYNLFTSMERKSEYVFINPNTGKKWGETAFYKRWRKIRDKAGLEDFRFHGLRHTVCTRLVKQNIPIPIVKEIMKHSDIKTTLRYTHVDSIDMINAVNVLDSYNNKLIQNVTTTTEYP